MSSSVACFAVLLIAIVDVEMALGGNDADVSKMGI